MARVTCEPCRAVDIWAKDYLDKFIEQYFLIDMEKKIIKDRVLNCLTYSELFDKYAYRKENYLSPKDIIKVCEKFKVILLERWKNNGKI